MWKALAVDTSAAPTEPPRHQRALWGHFKMAVMRQFGVFRLASNFQFLHSAMHWCKDNLRKELIDLLRYMLSECELHFGCARLLHNSNKSPGHIGYAFSHQGTSRCVLPWNSTEHLHSRGNMCFPNLLLHFKVSSQLQSTSQPQGGALLLQCASSTLFIGRQREVVVGQKATTQKR